MDTLDTEHSNLSGAGLIPFLRDSTDELFFLFHQTLSGKKINALIDFAGAAEPADQGIILRCACREFGEETGGLVIQNQANTLEQLKSLCNNVRNFDTLNQLESSEQVSIFTFKLPQTLIIEPL